MPELPEVEIARRNLERWALRRRIIAVAAAATRVLKGPRSPTVFARELTGARLEATERRGKNIVARLSGDRALRIHLGMTGKLLHRKSSDPAPRFSRAAFSLDDGKVVHYCDLRLFGSLEAGTLEEMRAHAFAGLGPDPFTEKIDGKRLAELLGKTTLPIKLALMDQARIAGVGNIHASEALWRAKLSPFRRASVLQAAHWSALAKGIRATLEYGLKAQETEEVVYVEEDPDSNPFLVYDRGGKPCRRCRTPIKRKVQGGRSTYWCPRCQR